MLIDLKRLWEITLIYEKNKERVLREKENRKIEIDRLKRSIEILKEQVKKLENE